MGNHSIFIIINLIFIFLPIFEQSWYLVFLFLLYRLVLFPVVLNVVCYCVVYACIHLYFLRYGVIYLYLLPRGTLKTIMNHVSCIESNTWTRVEMEFFFECLTPYLTSERSEKRNSIFTSNHVSFCLSYKHNSPFLRRKADFINEWK